MAVTFALTGDLTTLLGADFNPGKVRAHVRTNVAGKAVIDRTNDVVHLGDGPVTIASNGTFSVNLINTAATDLSIDPNTLQYELVVDYLDPTGRGGGWKQWASGWFSMTAAANIADKATTATPVPITTGDSSVASLVSDPGSASRRALTDAFLPVITPEKYGAVGDGVANDTAAVAAAFAAATALRKVGIGGNIWHPGATVFLRPGSTYKLSTLAAPIVASCNIEGAGATLVTAEGYANTVLLIGHDTTGNVLHDADMNLPNVTGTAAAAHAAGSVGVRVQNLTHSRVKFGRTIYYEAAEHYTGKGIGTAYNTIHPGWVDFCKIGYKFDSGTDGLGWANQNTFIGGGITQSPVWGLTKRAAGWRHIVMDGGSGNTVHGNTFVGVSLEGNLSERHIDLTNAADNQWVGATRFEQGDLGQAVTASAAFDSFTTSSAHGLAVGDAVTFTGDTMPAPLVAGTIYYVYSVSGNDFFITATRGGAFINITSDGANVKVQRPPTLRSDNTAGNTYGNRVHDGYNSWPGPLDLVQVGTAGRAPRPGINL